MLFVYAMLVMSTSAAILGLRNSPTDRNVPANRICRVATRGPSANVSASALMRRVHCGKTAP
jgi:hypothetical protein